MSTTLIADHLESVLLEIDYASEGIANCAADPTVTPCEVEQSLMQALETARRVLESALLRAQQHGVPKLEIDAA